MRMPSERDRRHRALERLIRRGDFCAQAGVLEALAELGFELTQSTLSRDLRTLGIYKQPRSGAPSVYRLPGMGSGTPSERLHDELRSQLRDVRSVGNLVLLLTPPGGGALVGRVVGDLGWAEAVGNVAGDDTVLVVTRSASAAKIFSERILDLSDVPR